MDPRKLVVRCVAVVCVAATLTAAGTAAGAASDGEPDWIALGAERLPLLSPCEPPNIPGGALCGTIEVPEDRSRPDGRKLGLHVVVLPARAEAPPSDPVTYFAGGPGGAASGRATALAHVEGLRGRDLLFID
jgi:hypothetical protein